MVSGALRDQGRALRQSSAANPCGCFYGEMVVCGPVLPFTLLNAYREPNVLLTALNKSREIA